MTDVFTLMVWPNFEESAKEVSRGTIAQVSPVLFRFLGSGKMGNNLNTALPEQFSRLPEEGTVLSVIPYPESGIVRN